VLVRPAGKVGGHRPGAGAGAAPPDDLGVALAAGGAVRTLQLALHVQGIGSSFQPAGPDAWAALAAALELAASWRPLGLLAAGRPG
jgi:hypothetical protein